MSSRPAIIRLFLCGSPLTVFGAIRAIIVDSFNGMLRRRLWTHIIQKILKRLLPANANHNSPLTVVFPTGVFGISAPSAHVYPRLPLGSLSLAVLGNRLESFFIKTAARLSMTGAKIFSLYDDPVAALTKTPPRRTPVLRLIPVARSIEHRQTTKLFTNHVNHFRHVIMITYDEPVVKLNPNLEEDSPKYRQVHIKTPSYGFSR